MAQPLKGRFKKKKRLKLGILAEFPGKENWLKF